jgi:hypothetical protein
MPASHEYHKQMQATHTTTTYQQQLPQPNANNTYLNQLQASNVANKCQKQIVLPSSQLYPLGGTMLVAPRTVPPSLEEHQLVEQGKVKHINYHNNMQATTTTNKCKPGQADHRISRKYSGQFAYHFACKFLIKKQCFLKFWKM